jgi:hypothetical protein
VRTPEGSPGVFSIALNIKKQLDLGEADEPRQSVERNPTSIADIITSILPKSRKP